MADQSGTRRDVLKSIGAASAGGAAGLSATGSATALEDPDDINQLGDVRSDTSPGRTVRIDASGSVRYSFAVTGVVSADGAPAAAVGAGEVSARTDSGTHTFSFSGEFTKFTLDGDAEVSVDGTSFDVEAFPRNTLEIVPSGRVSYDVSASGAVVVDEGTADRPNPRTANGDAAARHVLSYSGELTHLDVDGDATLRRNGTQVTVDGALPSTLPNEFTATARSGGEYTLSVSQEITTTGGTTVDVGESGQFTGGTTGRYGGRLQRIEHPSGASVELDYGDKTITCDTPRDVSAAFTVEAEQGLIRRDDKEAYDAVEFSVSGGESAVATWFGDVTKVVIDDLTVRCRSDTHPEAEVSARLQAAARIERTTAYRRLASVVDGRVRHDAGGIAAKQFVQADGGNTVSVEHRLANLERADQGVMTVRNAQQGTETAAVQYTDLEDDSPVAVEVVGLPTDGDPSTDKLRRETKIIDAPSGAEPAEAQPESDPELTAENFAGSPEPMSRAEVEAKHDLDGYDEWAATNDVATADMSWWGFVDWAWEFIDDTVAEAGYFWDKMSVLWSVIRKTGWSYFSIFGRTLYAYKEKAATYILGLKEAYPVAAQAVGWGMKLLGTLWGLYNAGFFEKMGSLINGCRVCVGLAFLLKWGITTGSIAVCTYLTAGWYWLCYGSISTLSYYIGKWTGFNYAKKDICGSTLGYC